MHAALGHNSQTCTRGTTIHTALVYTRVRYSYQDTVLGYTDISTGYGLRLSPFKMLFAVDTGTRLCSYACGSCIIRKYLEVRKYEEVVRSYARVCRRRFPNIDIQRAMSRIRSTFENTPRIAPSQETYPYSPYAKFIPTFAALAPGLDLNSAYILI